MRRIFLVLVALVSGLAFASAVPAAALAGLDTVPAAAQSDAAPVCADQAEERSTDFLVVTCKKKVQSTATTLCQQFQVVIPDAAPGRSGTFAHPQPGCSVMHVAASEPEAPTGPPRG
ncbi:MAG: hypothetical protein JJ913_03770 [Rhizobiaceae bacterium]|nr:hypothetical protein [Rhizobiaceae bacterium]